jgi:cupin fold WbuC family metalloprotein
LTENEEKMHLAKYGLRKANDSLFFAAESPVALDMRCLKEMMQLAIVRGVKRFRVCLHQNESDSVQEMLMVFIGKQCTPPHRTVGTKEVATSTSYHAISGSAMVRQYNETGDCVYEQLLSADQSEGCQFIRLNASVVRDMQSLSDSFIFLEVAVGPFERRNTMWV